jgi:hypothetical protein
MPEHIRKNLSSILGPGLSVVLGVILGVFTAGRWVEARDTRIAAIEMRQDKIEAKFDRVVERMAADLAEVKVMLARLEERGRK